MNNSPSSFRSTRNPDSASSYISERFHKSRRMRHLDHLEREFASYLATRIGPRGVVADVPCGSGRFSDIFANCQTVINLDYDLNMLAATRTTPGVGTNLVCADITRLPLANSSVDLVFTMRLFHHIGDPATIATILAEAARVSRNLVAVSFYKKNSWRYLIKRLLGKRVSGNQLWSWEFTRLAESCGLHPLYMVGGPFTYNQQTLLLLSKEHE